LEFAKQILDGKDKYEIYGSLQTEMLNLFKTLEINPIEIALFDRLLIGYIDKLDEKEIESSGYVLHTLEASIWWIIRLPLCHPFR
jgi:hypothetical protein